LNICGALELFTGAFPMTINKILLAPFYRLCDNLIGKVF
jgi:hypothetical protein